jgi:hypothetical protein
MDTNKSIIYKILFITSYSIPAIEN